MAETVELPEGQSSFKLNEVCKLANVQPYMLRFWGGEFSQLEAEKSGTGQRLYSRDQVELILEVRRLLFDEGLTIAGARKRLNAMEKSAAGSKIKTSSARRKKGGKAASDAAGAASRVKAVAPDRAATTITEKQIEERIRAAVAEVEASVDTKVRAAVSDAEAAAEEQARAAAVEAEAASEERARVAAAEAVGPYVAALKTARDDLAAIVEELKTASS